MVFIIGCASNTLMFFSPGLAGKTSWEVAQADVILGVCNDLRKEMVQAHFEKDEKLKVRFFHSLI